MRYYCSLFGKQLFPSSQITLQIWTAHFGVREQGWVSTWHHGLHWPSLSLAKRTRLKPLWYFERGTSREPREHQGGIAWTSGIAVFCYLFAINTQSGRGRTRFYQSGIALPVDSEPLHGAFKLCRTIAKGSCDAMRCVVV